MSIRSLNRQLIDAEVAADDPGLTKSQRRSKLAKVERLRVQLAKEQAREDRILEQRGRKASARR